MKETTKRQCQNIIICLDSLIDLVEYQIEDIGATNEEHNEKTRLYCALENLYDGKHMIESAIRKRGCLYEPKI